jgi:type I restriction enzyme S subunit
MEDTKKVPLLRFPEFSGDWEVRKLKKIASKINSKNRNCTLTNVLTNSAIQGIINQDDYFDRDIANKNNLGGYYIVDINDFIYNPRISSNALVGSLKKNNNVKGVMSPLYTVFRFKKGVLSFFEQYFETVHWHRYMKNIANTGARHDRLNITNDSFFDLPLPYPFMAEQQKIAGFLTKIDSKIEQLSKKKKLLENYKKGVMQKIFSQELRFKDDKGNSYPDWEEKKLGDFLTFHMTNSFSRSLLNYESGKIKNIHYGDIHTKFKSTFDILKEKVPFLNKSVDISKISDDCFCQTSDLIIADASEDYKDIGKAIEIINLDNQKLLAGLHTYIARDKIKFALGFKSYLFKSYDLRLKIMKIATGISVLGISKTNLSKLKVFIPSVEEQQKIADFLTAIDKKINFVEKQLNYTKNYKQGLLQKMFV